MFGKQRSSTIYTTVQFKKLLNMKYNKKNKRQYEKNLQNDNKNVWKTVLWNRSLFIQLL